MSSPEINVSVTGDLFVDIITTLALKGQKVDELRPGCRNGIEFPVDVSITILCITYFCFGVVYSLFGYCCLRTSMFITGFTFGTAIIYLICRQDKLFTNFGTLGVAVSAGVLFGTITMLIQYIGFFMHGLHTGLLIAVIALTIYDHFIVGYQTTYWFCILCVSCCAITFGVITLYWRRHMAIFGTGLYGGALIAFSLDYFCERLEMVLWLMDRVKLQPAVVLPCKHTWILLALWPVSTLFGILTQVYLTAKGVKSAESVTAQKRRMQHQSQSRPLTHEERNQIRQKKYRYLYQVRTAHGDVISQSYVKALQNKSQLKGNNANWNGGPGESSSLQSDSTQLTVLASSEHQLDSDEELNQIRVAKQKAP